MFMFITRKNNKLLIKMNTRKMKKLLLFFALFAAIASYAQDTKDTTWTINSDVALMFSQTSFTNWAPGGENNLTFTGYYNFFAGYLKGKSKWENMLALAYGQSKTGERGYRKAEDKIDFISTYGLEAAKNWYYSANFGFKSQFAEGYDYHDDDPDIAKQKISNFMAPGYMSLGIGMENKPKEWLSIYLSPATARWIFVNDQDLADAGAFGVEGAEYELDNLGIPMYDKKLKNGESTKFETGAYFRVMVVKEVFKNVGVNTKLELFSDYLNNPQNIDINWDTRIDMKVNSFLSANFGVQVVYDHDTPIPDEDDPTRMGPKTQIMEMLSVGLTYKMSNRK